MRVDLATGWRRPGRQPWKAVGEGLLAGLAGTAVMTAAQVGVLPKLPIPEGPQPRKKPRYPAEPAAKNENPTETMARRLVEGIAARHLTRRAKKRAGYLVHFATGAGWAAAWALFARRPSVGKGLLFGSTVWLLNEVLLSPALRITDTPDRYPIGADVTGFLAHLVYGAGTGAALRLIGPRRRLLHAG